MKRTIILAVCFLFLLTVSVCQADLQPDRTQHSVLLQVNEGTGSKELYDRAYSLYEQKSYYEAYTLFVQSQYEDWERMSKKCIRRWPKNSEIWHDPTQWVQDTYLTFRIEQPDDMAIFIKIYKDDSLISTVFIGGKGEVTVKLPGNGTYTIKDAVGSDWFGTDDAFGPYGAYEVMTFDPNDSQTIYLEARLDYLLTINIEDVIGQEVGSDPEEWANFRK